MAWARMDARRFLKIRCSRIGPSGIAPQNMSMTGWVIALREHWKRLNISAQTPPEMTSF
jgi:hypothetical protein